MAIIEKSESKAQRLFEDRLPQMGKKGPQCYEAIGSALALLDLAASCVWGCRGGDHRVEFLVARAVSSAHATLRLLRGGYYDEALSLCRTIGEIANLMALFVVDSESEAAWKSAVPKLRRREFAPVKVRSKLEESQLGVPISQERYGALSGFSIHAEPDSLPQAHNPAGQPLTFPLFQEAGVLLVLNELAVPLGFVTIFAAKVLGLSGATKSQLIQAGREIGEAIGGVVVTERGKPWFKLS